MKTKTTFAAACALLACAAHATEFRSSDVHNSDDYPTVAAVKHMSQVLAKESGGKYTIKVFNKSALGSEKETLDQVKIGALEMNRVNISSLNSIPLCPCLAKRKSDGATGNATGSQPFGATATRPSDAPRSTQRAARVPKPSG